MYVSITTIPKTLRSPGVIDKMIPLSKWSLRTCALPGLRLLFLLSCRREYFRRGRQLLSLSDFPAHPPPESRHIATTRIRCRCIFSRKYNEDEPADPVSPFYSGGYSVRSLLVDLPPNDGDSVGIYRVLTAGIQHYY
ncbi:hypothetical protein VTN77DRAFT_2364 [Rasamsonia byssochlamydoides]|uniref:uncharacterized protein n=1 Tax=Rasamsonia byssochlamydoides TaxID=89139 RepID=UPI003744A942